jgi:hypothetical protein
LFDIQYSKPTQPMTKKTTGQIEKETLALDIVGSATVPTGIGGHGGPSYFLHK